MRNFILLLISCFFINTSLVAQISALFNVDATEGCEPLIVQFTDASSSNGTIISWDWDFDDGSIDDVPNPIHTFPTTPGTSYDVCLTVEDDLAQTETYCLTISVLDNPIAEAGPDVVLTCDITFVELSAEGSSTGPEIEYEWRNSNGDVISFDSIASVSVPGEYTLIVTNTNTGCTASDEVLILQDVALPAVDISAAPFCSFPVTLDIGNSSSGSNFSYEWLDESGVPISNDTEAEISTEGIYTLIVTDTNNSCSALSNFEVVEPIPMIVSVDITEELLCEGVCDGSILATVNGGCSPYLYEWSNGANVPAVEGLCLGGWYGVTVTDCNGCVFTTEIILTEPNPLELSYEVNCATSANDGAINLTVSGGTPPYLYFWTGGNSTEDVENLAPGDYTVQVTDVNGCTKTETIPLSELIVGITNDTTVCDGDQLQLFVDAPDAVSYEWNPEDNLSCSDCPDPIYTADVFGPMTYLVTVEDAAGCIDQDFLVIYVPSYLDFNLLLFSNSPVFEGDTIELYCNVINPATVDWNGPDNFASTECNPVLPNATGINEGDYTVLIEDEYGCDASATNYVDVLTIIDSIGEGGTICFTETYQLYVDSPDAVSIEWSPAATLDDPLIANPIASPTATTTYFVTVEGSNGDVDIMTIFIEVDPNCVWPGDTDTSKVVDNFDLLNIGLAYDSIGPTRDNATILWDGQMAENWFITQPGIEVDFKHIDCNGDGFINADDTMAIVQNWGEIHNFTGEDNEVNFTVDPPFYVDPDTLIEGESISLPVILGEMDDPANDIYGIAFTLEYDSTVVVPGSAKMTFNDGWIGNKGVDMITIQKTFVSPGVIDIGMTRIDGEEMDGFGEIGQVFITIEDDILFRNGEDDSRNGNGLEVIFNISNVKIINNLGEEIPVNPMETITIIDGIVGLKPILWNENIQIQPNPTSDVFFITSKNIIIESISLFSMTGELLVNQKPNDLETKVNTQNLLPGIYLLKIQTELGVVVERVVVVE